MTTRSKGKRENTVQNEGRNALVDDGLFFRANVGTAWTGDAVTLADGSVLIRNPRRFSTGLPNGFSDTFGIKPEVITPDMVGKTIGVFCAIEYKREAGGKVSGDQSKFVDAVIRCGGRAGIASSAAEAVDIVRRPWE